jgi:hypothetical protein
MSFYFRDNNQMCTSHVRHFYGLGLIFFVSGIRVMDQSLKPPKNDLKTP